MSLLSEDSLKRELSAGRFAPAYLLFGEDAYLKKLYADRIAEKAVDGDPFFNLADFTGTCDLQALYDAVVQYPVMSARKCVRLTDYDYEHASSGEFDRLCAIFGQLNDTCVLVLRFDTVAFDPSAKKGGRAKKLLSALEKGGGRAAELGHRRPAELAKMLTDGAAKRGCRMEPTAARYLIETVGSDLNILRNELDKLTAYRPGGELDRAAIDAVCAKSVEASVYDLAGRIFACDAEGALRLLDDLFFMRVEPMIILYTVSAAYIDLYRVYAARADGVSLNDTAAAFDYGRRAFLLERAARQLRRFDEKKLSLSFESLLEADRRLKSFGADGRVILEELVVRLCWILSRGATA